LGTAQALAARDFLDVPELELLYKLKCSGELFYKLLADRIGSDEAAELLRRNGREELGHARRVRRAIAIKLGHDYEPSAEFEEPYSIELPSDIDTSVLQSVVQGELGGDADYQRWADAEPDPDVARLLRLNGREETGHSERVKQVIAILESAG
jgi:rubrerythrin